VLSGLRKSVKVWRSGAVEEVKSRSTAPVSRMAVIVLPLSTPTTTVVSPIARPTGQQKK